MRQVFIIMKNINNNKSRSLQLPLLQHCDLLELRVVPAHFLTKRLNGPPIKYLGLVNYLIN